MAFRHFFEPVILNLKHNILDPHKFEIKRDPEKARKDENDAKIKTVA